MTRLLLIGAAGLDWPGLSSRLQAGRLPNLARLRSRGQVVRLTGSASGEGPAAWATLATGEQPEVHGVFADLEPWAGGLRPTSRASWRVPPVWARLAAAGIATGSVGWPAAGPGADWPGVHLHESFAEASGPDPDDWALPLRCAPPAAREAIRERRVHPTEITGDMLAPLVPQLAAIDQTRDAALPRLAVAMAETATLQAGAAWILEGESAEAVFVHYPWLARVRAGFEPPPAPAFGEAVEGAWSFLDAMIGGLAALAGEAAHLLIVSPGWRGKPGVLIAAGPAIAPDPQVRGGHVLDIAPTALAVMGLEDPDLPGRILALPVGAERARAPSPSPAPPVEADLDLLRCAAERGYRPPAAPPPRWRADRLAALAVSVLAHAPERAREAAAAALAEDPDNLLAVRAAAMAHFFLEDPEPLPELAAALDRLAPSRCWGALARGAYHVLRDEVELAEPWLTKAEGDPEPDTLVHVAAVWIGASRPANAERVFREILRRDPKNASAELGLSMTAFTRRDFAGAEAAAQRALKHDPDRPAAYLQLAQIYARTARRGEAAAAAAAALRLGADEDQAAAAREGRLIG